MTEYTEIIDGFQIRDVTYFGESPKNVPIEFEIAKWQYFEPRKVIDFKTGKEKMIDRTCYAVAFLVCNEREKHFNFKQVGDRWERAKKTEKVIEMISEFTKKKGEELCKI